MSDAIAPDGGQHIDAAGNVTYEFDGHIHATGLELDGGQGDDNVVRWVRAADGVPLAQAYGYDQTGTPTPTPSVELDAVRSDFHLFASIIARLNQNTGAREVLAYEDGLGLHTIIDSDQKSSFLQLDTKQKLKLAFGFAQFVGLNVAPNTYPQATINHNLGAIPPTFFPFFSVQDAGLSIPIVSYLQGSMTANTMKVTLINPTNINLNNAQITWALLHT